MHKRQKEEEQGRHAHGDKKGQDHKDGPRPSLPRPAHREEPPQDFLQPADDPAYALHRVPELPRVPQDKINYRSDDQCRQ